MSDSTHFAAPAPCDAVHERRVGIGTRSLVGFLLSLAMTCAGDPLRANAASSAPLQITVPATEEGRAILEEIVRRATSPYLVSPDGSRSYVRAFPVTNRLPDGSARVAAVPVGGTWDAWAIELDDTTRVSPRVLRSCLFAPNGKPVRPFADLAEATVAPDGLLVLLFDGKTCTPIERFVEWPLPPAAGGASFVVDTDRRERLMRNPKALWPARSEAIVLAETEAAGSRADIALREPGGGPPPTERVGVTYELHTSTALTEGERSWLRAVLSPEAFAPLVESVLLWESVPATGARVTPSPPRSLLRRKIEITGASGKRSDLLRRRALVLLEEALGAAAPGAKELTLHLNRRVALPAVGDGEPVLDAPGSGWRLLTLQLAIVREEGVQGSLAAPQELVRAAARDRE